MTTTYIKFPITFNVNSYEEKQQAEKMEIPLDEREEDGFIYILIDGESSIYSFNEHLDEEKTKINLYDGSDFSLNLPIDRFIDKLTKAGCKIIQ